MTMIYYRSARQSQDILNNDKERQRWKCHFLYLEDTKSHLEKVKKNKIAFTLSMQKHVLVRLIARSRSRSRGEEPLPQ